MSEQSKAEFKCLAEVIIAEAKERQFTKLDLSHSTLLKRWNGNEWPRVVSVKSPVSSEGATLGSPSRKSGKVNDFINITTEVKGENRNLNRIAT